MKNKDIVYFYAINLKKYEEQYSIISIYFYKPEITLKMQH